MRQNQRVSPKTVAIARSTTLLLLVSIVVASTPRDALALRSGPFEGAHQTTRVRHERPASQEKGDQRETDRPKAVPGKTATIPVPEAPTAQPYVRLIADPWYLDLPPPHRA